MQAAADLEVANVLPPDFLRDPNPNIVAQKIDFATTKLTQYAGRYACVLDNVLTPEECNLLLQAAEATTGGYWERALVNIGGGRQAAIDSVRRCGRIIYDSQHLASLVWNRIANVPEVQEILRLENMPLITGNWAPKNQHVWHLTRPNERMRFLKYTGGEYFRPHCDGAYETPDKSERSFMTMHLYLSPSGIPSEDELAQLTPEDRVSAIKSATVGGATVFHAISMDRSKDINVEPKMGRILLFQHRDLLHSGDDVVQGTKYTMRTDIMYAREGQENQ